MNIRNSHRFPLLALLAVLILPVAAIAQQTRPSSSPSHQNHQGNQSHGSDHGQRVHRTHGGHWGYGGWGGWYGGYPGWGGYGGYGGYGWYGPPGGWGYNAVYPSPGATHGALDLDVSPEQAQIYVDGELVGIADDFDGYPDYLWLEKGTYDVVIFAPGYQTISRQYSIYAGLVIDVEDSMVPGQETLPQDLKARSTEHRDERLRRDRENEEAPPAIEGRRPRAQAENAPDRLDARGEPGRLVLHVVPDDASVYLDGRFLGTGREMARLRSGLIIDPGEHRLEVVRPGRQNGNETFSVGAGEEVRLDIELDEE